MPLKSNSSIAGGERRLIASRLELRPRSQVHADKSESSRRAPLMRVPKAEDEFVIPHSFDK